MVRLFIGRGRAAAVRSSGHTTGAAEIYPDFPTLPSGHDVREGRTPPAQRCGSSSADTLVDFADPALQNHHAHVALATFCAGHTSIDAPLAQVLHVQICLHLWGGDPRRRHEFCVHGVRCPFKPDSRLKNLGRTEGEDVSNLRHLAEGKPLEIGSPRTTDERDALRRGSLATATRPQVQDNALLN
jgi:hypothetical protein